MSKLKRYFIFIIVSTLIICTNCNNNELSNTTKKFESQTKLQLKNNYKFTNLPDLKLPKEEIKINFQGKPLQLVLPIYNDKNRLYIPLSGLIDRINGRLVLTNDLININVKNKNIFISNKDKKYWFYNNPNVKFNLKKNIIKNGDVMYMSLFDLTTILDLKTKWNIEKRKINLFWNKEKIIPSAKNQSSPKHALIRLEDIVAAQRYNTAEHLEKLRIVGDYLYSSGIPFHIAWVPRYIDKTKNIDNDPSKIYNMYNADFIFTMDYLINKNGIIGIHGYTHQFKDEVSIDGIEFSKKYNTDEKSIRERLDLAIKCANDLDLPYTFFETPHYEATDYQHKIMEQYFKYIYEPKDDVKSKASKTIYVPTPLNYVDGKEDLNNMINKINNLKPGILGSFFYHPNIEFEFIKLYGKDDDYPAYKYDENSVLHHIIRTFYKKGYNFISIMNLR
ncbi:DUF2334 domain-containing protein [Clostridium sp. BJN0013]|uniref:DUF2334 domain-containing protein n=1 Tax=Clostridium sp. BJN0013 TaxID=3236840 RepID=UPI0034C6395D